MSAISSGPDLATYDSALARHSEWLSEHRRPDGSFDGPGFSCAVYMPMPLYGHAIGRPELAEQAFHFVSADYLRDGELVQPEARRLMMPYTPAWFLMGASLGENLRLRKQMERQVLSYQDPSTGGFFGTTAARDAGRGVIEFDSTTQACAALAIGGSEAAAVKCGAYLRRLVEAQPDPSRRFFLQWESPKGLIREFDPKEATACVLTYAEPKQHLYKIGLLVRAFAHLYALTGDRSHLEMAEAHYLRAASNSPDVWRNALAHKMAWGARALFRLTGRRSYAEDACRMADHLVSLQQPDGGFHYPELWASYGAAPLDMKLNLGTQFAIWIAYARGMARA